VAAVNFISRIKALFMTPWWPDPSETPIGRVALTVSSSAAVGWRF
jgi:hypothetical protein